MYQVRTYVSSKKPKVLFLIGRSTSVQRKTSVQRNTSVQSIHGKRIKARVKRMDRNTVTLPRRSLCILHRRTIVPPGTRLCILHRRTIVPPSISVAGASLLVTPVVTSLVEP